MEDIIERVKYAYEPIGSQWSPPNWERLAYTLKCLPSHIHSALDLGPGQGQFLWGLHYWGPLEKISALDIRKHSLFHEPDFPIEMFYGNVTEGLPQEVKRQKFDLINAQEIFEHLEPDKLGKTIEELKSIAQHGQILFTVPFQEEYPLYHQDQPLGHKQSFDDKILEEYFSPCLYTVICKERWYFGLMSSRLEKSEKFEDPEKAIRRIRAIL